MRNKIISKNFFILLLISITLIAIYYFLAKPPQPSNNYKAVPSGDLATSIEEILSNCPYNSTDKSGVSQPNYDKDFFYISGDIAKINKENIEVKTYCGQFLVNTDSATNYLIWDKNMGINSTQLKSRDDFKPKDHIHIRSTIREGDIVAIDIQKILNE